jgi:ABC-type glycerol-3-phosphate transport system permease component
MLNCHRLCSALAMTVIMSLPILLIYFRAQKYFIKG